MNSDEASLAFENRQGRRPFPVQPEAMSTAAAFGVFGIGALVLIGWACHITVLKSLQPGLISMKANSAAAFMLTGLALWLLQAKRVHAPAARHAAWACASVVAALGLLTLAENVFRWDLGIDQLLFAEPAGTAQTVFPGRMAPNTALNFLLIGVSLFLLDVRTRRGHRPAHIPIAWVGIVSGVALLGYVYGVTVMFSPSAAANPMSVPTALAGLLAFASLLLARPGPWLLAVLTDDKPGSVMARQFFLPILLLPAVLDVVLLSGQHAGLYDDHIAAAAHAVLMTVIFLGVVLAATASLNRSEDKLSASGPGQTGGLASRFAMPATRPPAGLWSVWTVVLVAAATVLRMGFLQLLGTRATYITFYPAVTLAALYGGLPAGLLATVLSALVADYFWLQPTHSFAILDPADWLSIAIFTASGTLISVVVEAMHRARARASQAEAQARVAAEREQAAQALRKAYDELEIRVQQRTADLKQASAYNRSLLEASLDPLVTISPGGKITDVNEATVRVTGVPREQLFGTDFSDYFTEPEKAREGYRRAFAEGFVTNYPLTIRNRHVATESASPDFRIEQCPRCGRFHGELTDVFYNASVFKDARGNVIGVFAAARDITEQRRAQEEIRRFTDDLRRSNQELEHFAYVASHDLQEPLRVVSSFSQLLARRYQGKLDADADEFITFIVDGARRMQTLINDLLAYSRVGTRGHPFVTVEGEAVLQTALENLHVSIAESGAVITHDPLPTLLADPTQLTQLFQNLFSNAIKFRRPEAPPRIHVAAARQDGGWRLSVRDNGIGIDPQYFERIFIIFQRLHDRDKYPGTGIGLAVCKKIVERHGGRMWVESEPGTGSAFHFTIPEGKEKS